MNKIFKRIDKEVKENIVNNIQTFTYNSNGEEYLQQDFTTTDDPNMYAFWYHFNHGQTEQYRMQKENIRDKMQFDNIFDTKYEAKKYAKENGTYATVILIYNN